MLLICLKLSVFSLFSLLDLWTLPSTCFSKSFAPGPVLALNGPKFRSKRLESQRNIWKLQKTTKVKQSYIATTQRKMKKRKSLAYRMDTKITKFAKSCFPQTWKAKGRHSKKKKLWTSQSTCKMSYLQQLWADCQLCQQYVHPYEQIQL